MIQIGEFLGDVVQPVTTLGPSLDGQNLPNVTDQTQLLP